VDVVAQTLTDFEHNPDILPVWHGRLAILVTHAGDLVEIIPNRS
jgi:hypothetical protein